MEKEKSQHKLKIGQEVYFKNLSPMMTVDGYDENGRVICIWFEETENYGLVFKKHAFLEDTLHDAHVKRMPKPLL